MISKLMTGMTLLILVFLTACKPSMQVQTQNGPNNPNNPPPQVTGPFDGTWWMHQVSMSGTSSCDDTTLSISQSPTSITINGISVSCYSGSATSTGTTSTQALTIKNGNIYDPDNLVGTITEQTLQLTVTKDGVTETLNISLDSQPAYTDVVSADGFTIATSAQQMTKQPASGTLPTVSDAQFSTSEDIAVSGQLQGQLWIGDALTYAAAASPAHGTVSIDPAKGSFVYTPNQYFFGDDSFTFTAAYGNLVSAPATVAIHVEESGLAPIAPAQTVAVLGNASAPVTLTASDPNGNPLTFQITTSPSHGSLKGTAPNLTYTPNSGFTGIDSLTFKVNNGSLSTSAVVTLDVLAPNGNPVALSQSVSTLEGVSASIKLAGIAQSGRSLAFRVSASPQHGALQGTAPQLTYVPNADFAGSDSFQFVVNDGSNDSQAATVGIHVSGYLVSKISGITATSVLSAVAVGQKAFFVAPSNTNVVPWVTDGTSAGTLVLSQSAQYPLSPVAVGNKVFFFANRTQSTSELWITDGSVAGTSKLATVNGVPQPVTMPQAFSVQGNLLFILNTGSALTVYKSDGTSNGTQAIANLPGTAAGSTVGISAQLDSSLYVVAVNSQAPSYGLYRTDGTSANTSQVLGPPSGSAGWLDVPMALTASSSAVFFSSSSVGITRISASGTTSSVGTPAGLSFVEAFSTFGNSLLLISRDADTGNLWLSDGSASAPTLITSAFCKSYDSSVTFKSLVYASCSEAGLGNDPTSGLWMTDGTQKGTVQILGQQPSLYFVFNQLMFFSNGSTLFANDGQSSSSETVGPVFAPSFAVPLQNMAVLFAGDGIYALQPE